MTIIIEHPGTADSSTTVEQLSDIIKDEFNIGVETITGSVNSIVLYNIHMRPIITYTGSMEIIFLKLQELVKNDN